MSNQILRNVVRDISLVLFWVGVWEATTIMIEQKNKASQKSMIVYIYLAIISYLIYHYLNNGNVERLSRKT